MRIRSMLRVRAAVPLIAVTLSTLVTAPVASAQATADLQFGPDPAAIMLSADDLAGWTQTSSYRDLYFVPSHPPNTSPRLGHDVSRIFTRSAPAGGTQTLTLTSTVFQTTDMAAEYHHMFASGTHPTTIDVSALSADEAAGWWFPPTGGTMQGMVFARAQNVELVLKLVVRTDDRPDDTLTGAAAVLLQHVQDAEPAPPVFDWDQVLPGNPRPWTALLTPEELGPDWSGSISRVWPEVGSGPTEPLLDAQEYFNDGQGGMIVGTVSLLDSPGSATTLVTDSTTAATRRGAQQIPVPTRGDQSVGVREQFGSGAAARLNYTISFRRASWVVRVSVSRPPQLMSSPDLAVGLAVEADTKLAAALGQP